MPPPSLDEQTQNNGADVTGMSAGDRPSPLLIELDHSLIRTDLFMETALAYAVASPWRLPFFTVQALAGHADLEKKLAEGIELDIELIPLNDKVAELALAAKRESRQVFLVAAGDQSLAHKIAQRFRFIDGVVSSESVANPQSNQNAAMISGYDYVCSSAANLPAMRNARAVIAVEPSEATLRSIRALDKPTTVIEGKSRLRALVNAARLHQLAKNMLIFVPAVLSGTIVDLNTLINCAFAFLALGLVAIGTYLINDMIDLAHDRRHWSKRFRPIASGDLPIGSALVAALVSIGGGVAIASILGPGVLGGVAAYLVLTIAYSTHLKGVPILDVTVLATLFTLRLAIGIAAAGVVASPWLLVFSMALFTSLSIAKRNTEIQRSAANGETKVAGRGYVTADGPLVLGLGLATGTASIIILVLFLMFDALERDIYANPLWLWLFPIIIFLWLGRIWLVSQRGELDDDPVAFAIKDRQSLALGGVMAVAFVLAWLGAQL